MYLSNSFQCLNNWKELETNMYAVLSFKEQIHKKISKKSIL